MVDKVQQTNGGGSTAHDGRVVMCGGNAVTGFTIEVEYGAVSVNSAGSSSDGLRTYKRRRHATMCTSETKFFGDGKVAADLVRQLGNKTVEDPVGSVLHCSSCKQVSHPMVGSLAVMSGSNDRPLNHWKTIVLEQMCQSLCKSKCGIRDCNEDSLVLHSESVCRTAAKVHPCDDINKRTSKPGWVDNGINNASKGKGNVTSNGSVSESNHDPCPHAFFDIVKSAKFAQLCSLLMENFEGVKVDSFLDISLVNLRIKDGTYESSPLLFHTDMQKLWTKLQKVGAEMVALAKSLSDKLRNSYSSHVQFPTVESDLQAKLEPVDACGVYKVCVCEHCGEKVDGRNCLVCDSCEEMYHISCMQPAVEEIPSRTWYCLKCTAIVTESSHDNCVLCKKLNASRPPNNGIGDDVLTNEEAITKVEEDSNGLVESELQPVKVEIDLHHCNVCRNEVENGDNFMVCGHLCCPHKFYHVRCLTGMQLSVYGRCWYCPSCLCRTCLTDKDDDKIVLCDGCDHAYHIYCMQPQRTSIPRGKWFCGKCDAEIRRIHKAKRTYENIEYKLKRRGEYRKGASVNVRKVELSDKPGGVDILLTAARTPKYEE